MLIFFSLTGPMVFMSYFNHFFSRRDLGAEKKRYNDTFLLNAQNIGNTKTIIILVIYVYY